MILKGNLRLWIDENGISQPAFLEEGKIDEEMLLIEDGDRLKVIGAFGGTRFNGMVKMSETTPLTLEAANVFNSMYADILRVSSISVDKHFHSPILGMDGNPKDYHWWWYFLVKREATLEVPDKD